VEKPLKNEVEELLGEDYSQGEKKRLRSLKQYKNLSDEEFEEIYLAIKDKHLKNAIFERRIKEKITEFEQDYDISDLKMNDKLTLRALIQAMLALEDYEQASYKLQRSLLKDKDEQVEADIATLEKISKIMNSLRTDISRMQEDLKITRKTRKGDREESVAAYIENVKDRAKKFFESRVARVFCPNCKTLIGTVWVLYPKENENRFWFYCKRCDKKLIITYPQLMEKNLVNISDVPEF